MKNSLLSLGLLGAGLLTAASTVAVFAQPAASSGKTNKIVLEHCLISAFDQAQVPGREAGVLEAYEANTSREGTEVKKGDVLGHLDNTDLLAKKESAVLEIEVAQAKADSDAELEVAKATKAVAEKEVEGALVANKRAPGTVPQNELRRLQLQVDRARHEIRLREVERANSAREANVKRAQLKAVEVEIARREVIAPLDGVVVKRLKHEGEWVQPGETILEIVRLDRLRVEGMVAADLYSPQQLTGAKVIVSVETAGGQVETTTGVIGFVSPVVEASGDYRVWTEIANRRVENARGNVAEQHWLFRPGTDANMEVELKSGSASATRPVSTKLGR